MNIQTLLLTNPLQEGAEKVQQDRSPSPLRIELATYRNELLTAFSEADISGFEATKMALAEMLREVEKELRGVRITEAVNSRAEPSNLEDDN
ncbi:hypothetical protein HCZ23_04495 [Celeribacter sp. HF31]|uniref:hypothetical protein n=1 Tax=Celeribacter sp. HF31 TaxID=2721558 RepID=UPI0014304B64|nr:hypothetical protein [Celeribacter sp. HF31]NIY78724.1 hypothetical protein [Celeribacter sp. HF31]